MSGDRYTFAEAFKSALEFFNGDELAADVFLTKYALRDQSNELIECTPAQSINRVAAEFARIEAKYENPLSLEQIHELLDGFKYVIPQGSPLAGIGDRFRQQSLSNCFVIDSPYDSYGGILHTDQEQAQIMKRRGGVGFDVSTIRPKGMLTANAARTTDGIGAFMMRYSNTCREVAQGGRRGALLMSISCKHPEIDTFITIKRDLQLVTGANVSIKWTDEFMRAVQDDLPFTLQWPVDCPIEDARVTRVVRARDVWNKFVESAWLAGEPGSFFWDTVIRMTPADLYAKEGFRTVSSNPCGELVLSARDACRLIVMNTVSYVSEPFTQRATFDWELFNKHVRMAQRLMDDLVDLEIEAIDAIIGKVKVDPEPDHVKQPELTLWSRIRESCVRGRRTGLGQTGLGDAIAMLNMRYGSDESLKFVERLYGHLAVNSHASSIVLARERGCFPVWQPGRDHGHPFMDWLKDLMVEILGDEGVVLNNEYENTGRRNIALTTTAPVGSISMIARLADGLCGTSSGIESAIKINYTRRRKLRDAADESFRVDFVDPSGDKWKEYNLTHPGFLLWQRVTGGKDVADSPYAGATADDIDWMRSVDVQAAAQRYVEHSISKTCNLPGDATQQLVSDAYLRAWQMGCKGFTVYRDGSRTGVIVNQGAGDANQPKHIVDSHAPKRPKVLECDVHKCNVKGESWTMFVGMFDGRPYEVFGGLSRYVEIPRRVKKARIIKNGKKDGVVTYNLEWGDGEDTTIIKDIVDTFDNPNHGALTRTISLSLRHGIPIQYVCEQLVKDRNSDMFSFSRVAARVLKNYIPEGTAATGAKCPECGSHDLTYVEGCLSCGCGWRKCG